MQQGSNVQYRVASESLQFSQKELPDYWSPIMPQNTHLHFLNGTMSRGGHVLDIHIDSAEIFIQPINDVEIYLPDKEGF